VTLLLLKWTFLRGLLWYTYKENRAKWFKLTLEQVQEIISLNKNNEVVQSLEEYEADILEVAKVEFENVVGQDSLTRFDAPKRKKKRNNRNKSKKPSNQQNKSARTQSKPNQRRKKPAQGATQKNQQKKNQNQAKQQQPEKNSNRNKKRRPPKKVQTILKKHNYIPLFIGALLLFSCNSNMVYDQYKPIENHEWYSENNLEFIVSNSDTISLKNVFINIRNNKNYEFNSIFLIAKMEFPSGYKVVDTLEYEMTDAYGNWLGSGITDIKENILFYKENVIFSEKGDYIFNVQQATRSVSDIEGKSPLQGITDVGLRIEKVKE